MKAREWIAWLALCAVPVAVGLAVLSILPDTIALHFGTGGTPDRYGSKYEMMPTAALMSLANIMLAAFYWKADALFASGLMHGVGNPKNGRKALMAAGIIVAVMNTIVIASSAYTALKAWPSA